MSLRAVSVLFGHLEKRGPPRKHPRLQLVCAWGSALLGRYLVLAFSRSVHPHRSRHFHRRFLVVPLPVWLVSTVRRACRELRALTNAVLLRCRCPAHDVL